jgi:hypothetical protein
MASNNYKISKPKRHRTTNNERKLRNSPLEAVSLFYTPSLVGMQELRVELQILVAFAALPMLPWICDNTKTSIYPPAK